MRKAILTIALGAALLGGCSKSSDSTTASDASSPDADAVAVASPAAAVADAAVSPAGEATTIDLPVYPGAAEQADKGLTMSTGTTSVKMQIFDTKADPKVVIDWYKSHLPSNWQNFVLSNDGKTVGTFTSSTAEGAKTASDQSVIVSSESGVTRIQLTTKKGS